MKNIAYLRKERHLTQAQLAKKIGVATSTLGMYEQGRRTPEFGTVKELAKFFGVAIEYLTADAVEDTKQDHAARNPAQFEKFINSSEIEFDGEFYKLSETEREDVRLAMRVVFNQIRAKAMKARLEKGKQEQEKQEEEQAQKQEPEQAQEQTQKQEPEQQEQQEEQQ